MVWLKAQYCSEWTKFMVWHACSIPLFRDDHDDRVVRVYYPLQVFIID